MSYKVVIFGLLLVLFVSPQFVMADEHEQISQANRFLAAETARQIDQMQTEITQDLQEYQDENFLILDQRMTQVMEDTKWKVLLATLGAVMVGSAIVAFFLIRSIQNYSYEKYQEKLLKRTPGDDRGVVVTNSEYAEADYDPNQYAGVQEMQQNEWRPQQSYPTMSTQFGQTAASQMTQMNSWQMQPAYDGAWQSPEQPQREQYQGPAGYQYADQYQRQYQDQYPPQEEYNEDPMASPGWNPQGYQ